MKLLSILIIALASSYSFADHHGTSHHKEALGQAAAGMNRVNLGYNYSSDSLQDKNNALNEDTANTNRVFLNYERGFNDMFAAGIGLDYVSNSSGLNSDGAGFDGAGLEHISLFFKGNYNFGMGGLYYGVNVDLGLGANVTDADGSNNASLGSTDIAPYLAYGMNHGSSAWGIKVSYNIRGKQKFELESATVTAESEREGGNTLNIGAFYEMDLNDKSILGFGINHTLIDNSTDPNNNDAEVAGDYAGTSLDVYGVVSCGVCDKGGMYFIPKFSYSIAGGGEYENGDEYEISGSNYAIEMTLRKEF